MFLEVPRGLPLQMAKEVVAEIELDFARDADDDPPREEEKNPFGDGNADEQSGVEQNLLPRDPVVQIIDGDSNHLREQDPDGIRQDGRESAPDKVAPVAAHIREQGSERGEHRAFYSIAWASYKPPKAPGRSL